MGINLSPRFLRRPRVGALLIVATLAAAAHATPVPTVEVRATSSASGFELDGSLQPVQQATLAAQVPGSVLALSVKAGDRVRRGDVIARIDERDTAAGVAQADAAVAQAEANLRNARLHAERSRSLKEQNFVSQAALDVAETQLQAAEAGLAQARAGRSQAALARGFATVTAPFDAIVLATHVEVGDLAAAGRPIATVYAPGAMRAVVMVPSSRAAQARRATGVAVELPDGRRIEPSRVTPLPVADATTQTVEWRLDLPADAAAGQMPGASVRVHFAAASADAQATPAVPTVPASAVLRRGELTAVYVAQGERFVLRAVRTGTPQGDRVPLLAGVKAGERVAADPVRAGLNGAVPAP